MFENVVLSVKFVEGKENEGVKFSDYFDYKEVLKSVLLYWVLVIFWGCNEGIL